MRAIPVLALSMALAGLAPHAAAQSAGTLNAVVTYDIVLTVQGTDIPIDYRPDGTYSGEMDGSAFIGNWRIDGSKLCTHSLLSPTETCTEYPPGKRPGDVFEVTSPALGAVTVTINRQIRAPG